MFKNQLRLNITWKCITWLHLSYVCMFMQRTQVRNLFIYSILISAIYYRIEFRWREISFRTILKLFLVYSGVHFETIFSECNRIIWWNEIKWELRSNLMIVCIMLLEKAFELMLLHCWGILPSNNHPKVSIDFKLCQSVPLNWLNWRHFRRSESNVFNIESLIQIQY